MIKNLTKEQIKRFPEFVEKWTKIGLCTDPANRPEAEKGVIEAYKIAGLSAPKIVWCDSPLSQGLTRFLFLRVNTGDSVSASVWASVRASVRASVSASVWDSVWDSVSASVGDSVWASVRASVSASVWDSVWASVSASVGDSVWASVRASVGDSVYGQHESGWLSFYEYFKITCGLEKETEKLSGIFQIAKNAGWFLPHKKICFISERHKTLHRNEKGQLHADGKMALSYPDGWGIYALNGVRMKPEHVLTPSQDLKPDKVLAEKNVDQRRELIRKMGIEKMPHKTIGKKGDYELWSVKLSEEITDARFLKMLNPSVGCWHVEGVHPTCNTVQESLNWRATGKKEDKFVPEILT